MGKIFGRRQLNRDTLKEKLPEIFHIRGSCEVEIVGVNLFVISLDLETDRERIITDGPWHWFNELMLVKKVDSRRTTADMEFDEISMWIQLHNLPIVCMEPQILKRLGEQVGKVLEIDEGARGLCLGRYARIRVTRSIDKPLVQGIPIKAEGEEGESIVLVLYERLPNLFCFACGKIGHHMKDCDCSDEEKSSPAFGMWMKAGRGIDYRRVTHTTNTWAMKENPRGPRPLPRGNNLVQKDRDNVKNHDRALVVTEGVLTGGKKTNTGGQVVTTIVSEGEMEVDIGGEEEGEGVKEREGRGGEVKESDSEMSMGGEGDSSAGRGAEGGKVNETIVKAGQEEGGEKNGAAEVQQEKGIALGGGRMRGRVNLIKVWRGCEHN